MSADESNCASFSNQEKFTIDEPLALWKDYEDETSAVNMSLQQILGCVVYPNQIKLASDDSEMCQHSARSPKK